MVPANPSVPVTEDVEGAIEVTLKPPPAITSTQIELLKMYDDPGAPQTSDRRESGFISITKRSKVVLGNPALTVSESGNIVTINIVKMDTEGVVELTYKKMWAAAKALDGFATVTVTSDGEDFDFIGLGEVLLGRVLER